MGNGAKGPFVLDVSGEHTILLLTDEEYAELGVHPTEIRVINLGDSIGLHMPAINEYGYGATLDAALADISTSLKWFYNFLLGRGEDLTDGLAADLKNYREVMI